MANPENTIHDTHERVLGHVVEASNLAYGALQELGHVIAALVPHIEPFEASAEEHVHAQALLAYGKATSLVRLIGEVGAAVDQSGWFPVDEPILKAVV